VELEGKKKWQEALERFQSAIDLNPSYAASYLEWARSAVMLKRRKEALDKLTSALAIVRGKDEKERIEKERENLSDIFYTNDTFQQYQNGLNYLRLGRSDSAVDAIEKALKTEPDNLLVLLAYAKALQAEDRQKEALAALERAFALNDGKREVRVDLAELSLAQNPERTILLLKPLQSDAPDERVAWLQAQALSALKKNKDAIEYLKKAAEKQPDWQYAPFWLGKLYALEPNENWNARKYLMTFLKRTEPVEEKDNKDNPESDAEGRKLRSARAEAEAILARVNKSLE
jgi:tetratricopeptide (TPR) repeat protein